MSTAFMRTNFLPGLLAACLLSACGGSDGVGVAAPVFASPPPGDPVVPVAPPVAPPVKPTFGAQISFGDSLSDVGTYAVGAVKTLGGGTFTVNGDHTAIDPALTGKTWTAVLAVRLGLAAPCAAQTGLDGDASSGFAVPVENHAGCLGYAQGGARVTHPVGPGNKLTGSALGALTVPVATQIANHLAISGGHFKADDMVMMMAGGNDVLLELAALSAAVQGAGTSAGSTAYVSSLVRLLAAGAIDPTAAAQTIGAAAAAAQASPGSTAASVTQAAVGAAAVQPGNSAVAAAAVWGPMVRQANTDATTAGAAAGTAYFNAHAPDLVDRMTTAGAELAALVKDQVLGKGAQFVVVNNLPDVAGTPAGLKESAGGRGLIAAMVQAFNAQLDTALSGDARVLLVDAYALSHETAANPAGYGLTNVTDTACDLNAARNPLQSSLVCNGSNLKPGDVSHYAYADEIHPTPYYHALLAGYVAQKMAERGWL
ncbi:hypothetical protein D9M72_233080 [compost metagenome]